MSLASMFGALKSTAISPVSSAFEARVAGVRCDNELANSVLPDSWRWVVTKLDCKE